MSAIVNSNLAGFTVKYNGVQFGGADASGIAAGNNYFRCTPPMYSFNSQFRYDGSDRAVIGTDHRLRVQCIVYESSEALMAANMQALRSLLSVPAKKLELLGLGSGFGSIFNSSGASGDNWDIDNGPKPRVLSTTPIGNLSWELVWEVTFFTSECVTVSTDFLAFLAFNFNTTWQNDFEGLCTRTISGYVLIPQVRREATSKTVLHVAEETRGSIVINIPTNFSRVQNVWRESDDKGRLDFTIVDEQLEGDALPAGITAATGSFSFATGNGKDSGMSEGVCSLSMSLKTAPNQHRNLAGQLFLAAVLSKQAEMAAGLSEGSTIVPVRLSIANGKFSRARQTDCSITWVVTSCLSSMLTGVGIWTPVGTPDYTTWKASMASLWGNRGFSGITSSASEAVVIDVCDNTTTKTIGTTSSSPNSPTENSLASLTCPEIADDGGWMMFDLEIRVLREDHQTLHRKAASYLPNVGNIVGQDPEDGDDVAMGGPDYSQSASDQHVQEYHGYPETFIGLKFKGLRFKNKPYTPELKTVAGMAALPYKQDPGDPKWAFDSFGCPVWYVSGWRIYRVPGYVPSVKAIGSKASCGASTVVEEA